VVECSLKFPYSSLSLSELLPYWAFVMMGFRSKSNKVFQAIIIPNSIDMMNLPAFGSRSVSIFPNNNMLKYLMPSISSWVIAKRKKNIASSVLNSTTFPVRILIALATFIVAFATLVRASIHPTTATRANLTISLGIFIGIAAPFSSLFFNCHEYIIADETQLSNGFMPQKPTGRPVA